MDMQEHESHWYPNCPKCKWDWSDKARPDAPPGGQAGHDGEERDPDAERQRQQHETDPDDQKALQKDEGELVSEEKTKDQALGGRLHVRCELLCHQGEGTLLGMRG